MYAEPNNVGMSSNCSSLDFKHIEHIETSPAGFEIHIVPETEVPHIVLLSVLVIANSLHDTQPTANFHAISV